MSKPKMLGEVFKALDDNDLLSRDDFAKKVWQIMKDNNIHPSQLNCDKSLIKLGLAELDIFSESDSPEVLYEDFEI